MTFFCWKLGSGFLQSKSWNPCKVLYSNHTCSFRAPPTPIVLLWPSDFFSWGCALTLSTAATLTFVMFLKHPETHYLLLLCAAPQPLPPDIHPQSSLDKGHPQTPCCGKVEGISLRGSIRWGFPWLLLFLIIVFYNLPSAVRNSNNKMQRVERNTKYHYLPMMW